MNAERRRATGHGRIGSLARAWAIFLEDLSDDTDEELTTLLPSLSAAGYVLIDGESPAGCFWRFTPAGVERAAALGLE
jgi:hypothetical protein